MRDILPSGSDERRSIRNIPISSAPRRGRPVVEEDYREAAPRRRPRRFGRAFKWTLAVVLFGGLSLLLSAFFAGATVTVYPRTATVEVPARLEALLNAPLNALAYETFTVTRSATTATPATGTKTVSRQASGIITILNSYSSASQRLIANTRFEAPDGKIYRIRDSVTVPGQLQEKPGTATITAYADSPGSSYNKSGSINLVIAKFKEDKDPRATAFKVTAAGGFSGGFLGEEPAVAAGDLAKARDTLQKQLVEDIRAAASVGIPEGYLSIPSALQLSYSEIAQSKGNGNNANLSQTATGKGIMLREGDLAAIIARQKVEEYGGEAIGFEDISQMAISLASTSKSSDEKLVLLLTGTPTLVWQFDPGALSQALLGKEKGAFQEVVNSFAPAIRKADASIRPFWEGSFPNDIAEIKIVVAKEE